MTDDPELARAHVPDSTDQPADLPGEVEIVLTCYVYPSAEDTSFPEDITVDATGAVVEVVDREPGARTHEGIRSGQQFWFTLDIDEPTADSVEVSFHALDETFATQEVDF